MMSKLDMFVLRGVDGRGHFQTELISFKRRALYKDKRKYPYSKAKIYRYTEFVFTK